MSLASPVGSENDNTWMNMVRFTQLTVSFLLKQYKIYKCVKTWILVFWRQYTFMYRGFMKTVYSENSINVCACQRDRWPIRLTIERKSPSLGNPNKKKTWLITQNLEGEARNIGGGDSYMSFMDHGVSFWRWCKSVTPSMIVSSSPYLYFGQELLWYINVLDNSDVMTYSVNSPT